MNIMKRLIILLALVSLSAISAHSQSKIIGARIGANTIEASYLEEFSSDFFFEANAGFDIYKGETGIKAELLLNYVVLNPSFTSEGEWSVYTGLGIAAGYVYDMSLSTFTYRDIWNGYSAQVHNRWGKGPMIGVPFQVGISYTFDFPVRLSLDIRPTLGFHLAKTVHPDSNAGRLGIYGAGLANCYYPRLSVHYFF